MENSVIPYRLEIKPAFWVTGVKTLISGPNNEEFGLFWEQCREKGVFEVFKRLTLFEPGPVTHGVTLGISRVEHDPDRREFFYMVAVEKVLKSIPVGFEVFQVPASQWAIFECHGKVPESIIRAEIHAFTHWLPESGFIHARAPEMEVYPPHPIENYCEFWLPVERKPGLSDESGV